MNDFDLPDMRAKCKPAPAHFPYRHRNMAQVMYDEFCRRDDRRATYQQWAGINHG